MKNKENKEQFINNTGNNIIDKNKINNINIKNKESKKGGDDTLVKMLSKGEANYKNNIYNKNSKPASTTDMEIISQIINNPSFMTIIKTLSQDKKMIEHLNKMPEIQELQKTNPIFKKALKGPELMKKITDIIETFNEMSLIIDEDKKNKEKENKEKENKEKENNNINDLKTLEDKFNYLKNMGFKDDKLIEEALLVCEGNIDEAIEYINSLKKEEGK